MRSEEVDVAREHRFAAEIDNSQMGKEPIGRQAIAHLPENGRDGMKYGDSFAIEPVSQPGDALPPDVVRAKRRAAEQPAENVHVGRVEAQRIQQG